MTFGFWEIVQVLGSLAFFIYGMKVMSDGIQRAAGSQMRTILSKMTKNRFLGVFTGFLITALVQSSSATTVMTVSFVNAGLLSLVESAGVMMGANIGTTITGWIVSLLGFKIQLSAYSIPLFAVAVPMLLSSKSKLKYWGEFLLGFAILFLGLSELKEAMPDGNPEAMSWLKEFADLGFGSRIIFVIIGAFLTIIIQSSSAAMAFTLALVAEGWLTLDIAAAMVLGENIGTTITAELASLVGNTSAKRSARIHSMFNIIGVCWMLVLLPVCLPLVEQFMIAVFGSTDAPITLAAFHTFFNITNVILLLGFVPFLVKAAIWSVKGNAEEEEEDFRLKFIASGTRTPELATVELQKEAAHFGEVVSRMSAFTKSLINTTDEKEHRKILKRIEKYESISDRMEEEITEYVTRLADKQLTNKTSVILRSVLNICNDLERIGDIYYQISKTLEMKFEQRSYFTPKQRKNINELCDKIDEAFLIMVENLSKPNYDNVSKAKAVLAENEINKWRDQLRDEHFDKLGSPEYNVKSAMIYTNIFQSLEKVGDHIINISEAIKGEI